MKTVKFKAEYILPLLFACAIVLAPGCSKDDDNEDLAPAPPIVVPLPSPGDGGSNPNDTTTKPNDPTDPVKTKTEILSKKWIVDEAFAGGLPDRSSKGLTLDVRKDGSYTLSTGWVGTWEFNSDESKITWDKGHAQYEQIFTLRDFKENRIEATFKSAFTGQNARWVMIPF